MGIQRSQLTVEVHLQLLVVPGLYWELKLVPCLLEPGNCF